MKLFQHHVILKSNFNFWIVNRRVLCLALILIYLLVKGGAQDTIRLKNGSFEDTPHRGDRSYWTGIKGWFDCGPENNFMRESPPDIHPNGFWNNHLEASVGKTYLGLVARDNGTYESVSQKLKIPLQAGKCYKGTIHLARSEDYQSLSRATNQPINYNLPLILKIYGGSSICNETVLLVQSQEIEHTNWLVYDLMLQPKETIHYLTLVAYYKNSFKEPYCGNLLVDGLSDFISVDCE